MATDYVALLAERKQQPAAEAGPTDYVALAEQRKQKAFEEKESKKNPILRKAAELGRGAVRGFGETAVGITDLVGDTAEAVGLPRGPFAQNEDVERIFPQSSGSKTERAGEMVGDFFSLPGGGAGKTIASTVARAAAPAALYGAAHSEGEGLDRAVDATKAAILGGGTAGALHGSIHGVGKVDPKARQLEETLNARLGDSRIGGELPLAQRVDQSKPGGKMLAKAAARLNTGQKGFTARDRSQRINDDVYRMQAKDAYEDVPGAFKAGEEAFNATRNAKVANKMAEKVVKEHTKRPEIKNLKKAHGKAETALRHRQQLAIAEAQEAELLPRSGRALLKARHKQELQRQAQRAGHKAEVEQAIGFSPEQTAKRSTLKKSLGMKDHAYGRYSADSTLDAGDAATSELMSPLRTMQHAIDKPPLRTVAKNAAGKASAAVAPPVAGVVGAIAGGPVAGAATAAGVGAAELAARKWMKKAAADAIKAASKGAKKAAKKERHGGFVERVGDLPQLKDPAVQRALLGDTKVQKQMQELLQQQDMDRLQAFFQRLTVTGEQ